MRRFETSIKNLIEAQNQYLSNKGELPFFLSDWDADIEEISFPNFDFHFTNNEVQKYYYWTDKDTNQNSFHKFILNNYDYDLLKKSFTISSNGTSSIFLTLLALQELDVKHVLVFTPTYFTLLNTLDKLNFDVSIFNIELSNDSIDYSKIDYLLKHNKIDAMFLTNPLFGTGIELQQENIKIISKLANKYDIWFVMDYIYGGMLWNVENEKEYIFNFNMLQAISQANKYVMIESISKRLFLNGAKFAFIFSSEKLIRHILRLSLFSVGSMAVIQTKLAKQIYESSLEKAIITHIKKNIEVAKNNYSMIRAILLQSKLKITPTNCGYFSLVSIPQKQKIDDMQFAIKLINEYGIMTTPHSRYLYYDNGYYSFRINLLLNANKLQNSLITIKTLFE